MDTVATAVTPQLTIRKYGDPCLRKKTKPVEAIDDTVRALIKDMFHVMHRLQGIGLAANQVGLSHRMLVIDLPVDGKSHPLVLINPEREVASGRVEGPEGCLSFPGLFVSIPRPAHIRVRALNEHGLPVVVEGQGLLARALDHEIDHLDGKLFIDYLPMWKRLKIIWEIRRRKLSGTW
ncbi:MAG: peptide deformylase [Elusimicrobia bacterium]|nr:peptide deformylase [Elusimicrobiota bacterium]